MSVQFIEESGLRIGLPLGASFRFQQLPTYRASSGKSLKAIDCAWQHNARLHRLEVRDYRHLGS